MRRFGEPLPAWVRPRLAAAGIERLDEWALGNFDAVSLEGLLAQSACLTCHCLVHPRA